MNENSHMQDKRDAAQPIKSAQPAAGGADLNRASGGAADIATPGIAASKDADRLRSQEPLKGGAGNSSDFTDLLRLSRSELDGLFAETRSIHERGWKALQSLLDDLQMRAWQAVNSAVDGFQKEVHERVGYEVSTILENLDIEASSRLAARVDQALAKAKDDQRRIEQGLSAFAAENQKTAAEASAKTAEEMQRRAGILRAEFQSEAQSKVEEVKKAANEAAKGMREAGQAATNELGKRTGQALLGFQTRLEQLERDAIGRAEKRINEMTSASVATVAKQAQEAADREVSKFFLQAIRNRLDQLADVFKQPNSDAAGNASASDPSQTPAGDRNPSGGAAPEITNQGSRSSIDSKSSNGSGIDSGDDAEASPPKIDPTPRGLIEGNYAARENSFKTNLEPRDGSERSYGEYAPAYRFGYALAADSRYRGKDWLTIEPEAKRAWEIQGGGKWEKFKGSIQYAWLSALGNGQK